MNPTNGEFSSTVSHTVKNEQNKDTNKQTNKTNPPKTIPGLLCFENNDFQQLGCKIYSYSGFLLCFAMLCISCLLTETIFMGSIVL